MRLRRTAVATALLMTLTAAPALADYPPVFTKASTVRTWATKCGFTVGSSINSLPASAQKWQVKAVVGTAPRSVTVPSVLRNTYVAPSVSGLPARTAAAIKLFTCNTWVVLGTASTSGKGGLQFPALLFKKPGTYVLMIGLADGNMAKLRVVIR